MPTTKKAKEVKAFVMRFMRFMRVLVSNKRGMVGIGILTFFILLAIVPPLLTPYDPVQPPADVAVAADLAFPLWFKYLPGYGDTSENLMLVGNPNFTTATSLEEWSFATIPSSQSPMLEYVPDVGSTYSGPGCVAIAFERSTEEPSEEISSALTKQFYYPYNGPPKRFRGQIYVRAEGVKDVRPWGVEIKVFIQKSQGEKRYLWSAKQGGNYSSEVWITPCIAGVVTRYPPLIDSNMLDPQRTIFSEQTNYTYGVEVVFSKDVQKATVYVDDLDFRLYGTGFGLLGTDNIGRDIFTQLIYGTRISLLVGLLASFISVTLGLCVGLFSAYLGKIVDETLMRFTDMMLVLPELPLLLVIIAVLGPSIWYIILIIGILGWMGFARTVRSQALSLKERPFVEASKALGSGKLHVIGRHILPNVMNLVYVTLAISVPGAIMAEAYLSFLGLYDPFIMTWGRMFHEALELPNGVQRWWWIIPPGLAIAAISISFILIGYALDEILNPKLRERR